MYHSSIVFDINFFFFKRVSVRSETSFRNVGGTLTVTRGGGREGEKTIINLKKMKNNFSYFFLSTIFRERKRDREREEKVCM